MEAVILIGVPGAGKSTFYLQRFAATHQRLSLDELGTRQKEHRRMLELVAARIPFVVDDTNILRSDRAVFIATARAAGYKVCGYVFRLPLRAAIKRNVLRTGKGLIPVPALIRSWKRLEPPTTDEGFHGLWAVDVGADGGLTVVDHATAPPPA